MIIPKEQLFETVSTIGEELLRQNIIPFIVIGTRNDGSEDFITTSIMTVEDQIDVIESVLMSLKKQYQ